MAYYGKARAWVIERCRDPVPDVTIVTSVTFYGHMEDVGPTIVVVVGRLELKLHHPLAREAWKSCQEGILLQFNRGLIFKDGSPTWMIS